MANMTTRRRPRMPRKAQAVFLLAAGLLSGAAVIGATSASATEKVTICHASGLAGTTKYETLTIGYPAVYGPAGHFYENGTPRAGHEQDYLGACVVATTTTTTRPGGTTTTTEGEGTTTTTTEEETTTTTTVEVTTTVPEVTTTVPEPECTGDPTTDPSGCPIDDCSLPDGNRPAECDPSQFRPSGPATPVPADPSFTG